MDAGLGMRLQVIQLWIYERNSTLPLLVAEVLADHHDAAVATNDLALVADRLDARVDLHGRSPSSDYL